MNVFNGTLPLKKNFGSEGFREFEWDSYEFVDALMELSIVRNTQKNIYFRVVPMLRPHVQVCRMVWQESWQQLWSTLSKSRKHFFVDLHEVQTLSMFFKNTRLDTTQNGHCKKKISEL